MYKPSNTTFTVCNLPSYTLLYYFYYISMAVSIIFIIASGARSADIKTEFMMSAQ